MQRCSNWSSLQRAKLWTIRGAGEKDGRGDGEGGERQERELPYNTVVGTIKTWTTPQLKEIYKALGLPVTKYSNKKDLFAQIHDFMSSLINKINEHSFGYKRES